MMNQAETMELFMQVIQNTGSIFDNKTEIFARHAVVGEVIIPTTSDGVETKQTAIEGDMVVQNHTEAKERYIISGKKFAARYVLIGDALELGPRWNLYKAVGRIRGITYWGEEWGMASEIHFVASWGEEMVLKDGDMIATPLPQMDEIYRIAAKEFGETYEKEA